VSLGYERRDERLKTYTNPIYPYARPADSSGAPRHWPVIVAGAGPVGLTAAIDLAPKSEGTGIRGMDALAASFHDHDILLRITGDTIALTPPLIVSENQIGEIVDKVAKTIRSVA